MYLIIIILVAAITLFLVWASSDIGSNIYLKATCKAETQERVVALTFDDGPAEPMTLKVLDILRKYDAKAAFFLIGRQVDKYPDIARRIVVEGHIVANHTMSHSGLFPLSSAKSVKAELLSCSCSITKAVGLRPKLFRPPFGVTNPIIGRMVKQLGFNTIGWSIRSLDTVTRYSREDICRKVERSLHPGAIILLHDRCLQSDELLESIILAIVSSGYRIVALDELLNIDVYEN